MKPENWVIVQELSDAASAQRRMSLSTREKTKDNSNRSQTQNTRISSLD
jgi:hypothetical protein